MKACLKYLTVEEFHEVIGKIPPIEDVTINDIVKIVRKALKDSKFREVCLHIYNVII